MNPTTSPPLITVCIPTYNRPERLELAIRSVLEQRYAPAEIVVGDDSSDDRAQHVVERFARDATNIRYRRNVPRLGQNANVNALFDIANGAFIVLLHDDDLLAAGALSLLVAPVLENAAIRLVFGKQIVLSSDGKPLARETATLNATYFRDRPGGAIDEPLAAALRRQIPSNGFLISTELAKDVGYRSEAEIGIYGDADFAIRVAARLERASMWFVDAFVSYYRLSADAISTSRRSRRDDHPYAASALYRYVRSLSLSKSSERARADLVRAAMPNILRGLMRERDRRSALRLFFSREYGWRRRLSLRGVYHLTLIAVPAIDRLRK